MKKYMSMMWLLTMLAIFAWGCTEHPSETTSSDADRTATQPETDQNGEEYADMEDQAPKTDGEVKLVSLAYCGKCGHQKGSELCCKEGAAKCEKCGLAEGSKLCCVKLSADAKGKDLCGKCGHVEGTEICCKKDAQKCEKCGLANGSPLCCKLTKKDADKPEDAAQEPAPEEKDDTEAKKDDA